MNAILKYPGGKWRIADWIISYFPEHKVYCEAHYNTMAINDICKLPVNKIANDDCALLMWATFPNLEYAFQVCNAWGFTYKTVAFVWVKQNKKK